MKSEWILEYHAVYKDGKECTSYFKGMGPLCLFFEMGNRDEAKRFRTKKAAQDFARSAGRAKTWVAVRA